MTHFIGAVIIPAHISPELTSRPNGFGGISHDTNPALGVTLQHTLAKFNENIAVDPYVEEDDQAVIAEEARKAREWSLKESNRDLSSQDDLFVLNHHWSDGYERRENGDIVKMSTYNPFSKWDWFVPLGRWTEEYTATNGHSIAEFAKLIEEDMAKPPVEAGINAPYVPQWRLPSVLVVPKGEGEYEWMEAKQFGWFGTSTEVVDPAEWPTNVLQALKALPQDAQVIYVDFHI